MPGTIHKPLNKSKGKDGRPGRFFGVGVGPGDPGLLTVRAVEIFCSVDVIFFVEGVNTETSVSGSVVDSIGGCTAEKIPLIFSMAKEEYRRKVLWEKNVKIIAEELLQGHDCAFATIGDPLLYSTYSYIIRELKKVISPQSIETVPGITAFQAVAARRNIPLVQDSQVLAIVPAWTGKDAAHPVLDSADTIVLLKTYKHKDKILRTISERNLNKEIIYAERVCLDGEFLTDDISQVKERNSEYLSLMIVKKAEKSRQ